VLAVLPGRSAHGRRNILISGSAAAIHPIPYNATYAATKALVNTFSESCAAKLT